MSFSSVLFFASKFRRIFASSLGLVLFFGIAGLVQSAYATPATTTTTLAVTASGSAVTTVVSGTVVTLTATVLSGATAVTPGQVNFCDGSPCMGIHVLGTAQLTSAGSAVLRLKPGIGSHSYEAVFVGTSSYVTSTSSATTLSVTGSYTTTTTIAQSGSAGNYTLTATVAGLVNTHSTPPAPTGTVSFLDTTNSNAVLGTASLGTGTLAQGFAAQSPYSTGTGSNSDSIAVGDFNGDGIPDLAVANYGSSTVGIFLGNGDGTFQSQATYSTGSTSQPNFVTVGDFNGDGKLDLAVTSSTTNTVSIFLGNGDGTFPASANDTYTTGSAPTSIAVGDFNGDGKLDLAVTNYGSSTVSIFLGNGDGTFQTQVTYAAGYIYPRSVAVGDFNGDGKLDLAVVIQPAGVVSIFLGNGDGTFPTSANYTYTTGSQPISVAVGDFNGDGKPDLAIANLGDSTVSVLLGNGDGSFNPQVTYTTDSGAVSLAVSDLNGDGKPDLAVASQSSNTVSVLLGNGDGTFQSKVPYATGSTPNSVAVGDFNGDGIPDLAVANNGSSTASVLLGQWTETATTSASGISPVGPSGSHVVEASYPGDSSFAASTSSTTSLTAQPAATTLTLSANPTSSTYSQQVVLTATLSPYTMQGYGTNGDTVTFSNNGTSLGTGTLSGGVAIFNVTSLPVGTNSLTAAYAGDTDFGSSSTATAVSYSVSKATPTISISNLPTSGTYGGNFTPTFSYTGDGTTSVSSNSTGICTVTSGVVHYVGVGTCSLTASATSGTNYSAATGAAQAFTVGQATATVSLGSLSQTYTSSALAATATTNPSGLTVNFTYNGSSTAPTTAGSYAVVGTISDTNYQGTASGTLVINKATPTVSAWATASAITYGQTLASSTLTGGTASVAGSFAWTTSTTSPGAGSQSESVTFTPSDTTDYNTVTGTVTLTVNKATPTVSAWPSASAITYGQTLASSTLSSGAASVPGSFAWATSTTSPGAGSQSESVTFTPSDTTDYSTLTGTVALTVNKATPSVSVWPTAGTLTYGQSLANSTLTGGTASVAGSFAWTTPSTSPGAGSQSESVTFTPDDTNDYDTVTGTAALTVNKATPTVSVWPAAGAITYGQTLASSTLTGGTASVAGSFAWTTPNVTLSAGSQSGSAVFAPSDSNDYNSVTGTVTLSVAPAPLSIAVNNASRAYGAANPTFTGTVNGLQHGDTASFVTYSTSATQNSSVGTYPINATITSQNYALTATQGTLTVGKANSSVALSSQNNLSTVNQSVTFNAAIAPVSGIGAPTGTVTFTDVSTANSLCTATINSGQATCTTAALGMGINQNIQAAYSGDSNFNTSSGSVMQSVLPGTSSVTVTTSPNPSVVLNPQNTNDAVNLMATVSPSSGAVKLSGSVTFTDNGAPIAECLAAVPVNPATGIASCLTKSLGSGTHTILAVYNADRNYATSSGSVSQQIEDYALTTSVTNTVTISQGFTNETDPFTPQAITITAAPIAGFTGNLKLNCDVVAVSVPTGAVAPTCSVGNPTLAVVSGATPPPVAVTIDAGSGSNPKATPGAYSITITSVDAMTGLTRTSAPVPVDIRTEAGPLTLTSGETTGNTVSLDLTLPANVGITNLQCVSVSGPTLAASVTPVALGMSCIVDPNTISASSTIQSAKVTVTINTGSATTARLNEGDSGIFTASLLGLPVLLLFGLMPGGKSSRKLLCRFLVVLCTVIIVLQGSGCGGGFTPPPATSGQTPPGAYSILVQGTGTDNQIYQGVIQLNVTR